MEALKNKLITIKDVLKIGEILDNRLKALKDEYAICERENEGKEYNDEYWKLALASYSELKFAIISPESREEQNSFEWFKENLTKNASKISGISIDYSCHFARDTKNKYSTDQYKEEVRLHLDSNYYSKTNSYNYGDFNISYSNNNTDFIDISRQINGVINSCSPRFDKTLKNKQLYRLLPSFAISIIISLFAVGALYLLSKFSVLPENIALYILTNPLILLGGGLILTILLGIILPNPNMSHFNKIFVDKKYKTWDRNWDIDHYENDIDQFKNQVEFAVGRFYGSDKSREKIKKNFKISMFVLLLGIVAYVVLAILMFI